MEEKKRFFGRRFGLLLLLTVVSLLATLILYLIGAIIVSFIVGLGIKKMSHEHLLRNRSPEMNRIEIFLAMELGFVPVALATACFFPTIHPVISVLSFLSFSALFFLLGRLTAHLSERKKQKTEG
jgi:hypothetical protein